MGYEQVENIRLLTARNFSAGWFPGKKQYEIPGDLASDGQVPIGAYDCDHVVYYLGSLKKMFGFNNVNTAALNSGAAVNGLIDFTSYSNNLVGVVGDKLYSDLHTATPTDITGALTISATTQVNFLEFRLGSTKMVVGCNGVNAPFKWLSTDPTGTALGGAPPNGKWIEYFNGYVFMAGASGNEEKVYFSALGNSESWDTTNNFFSFDDAVTGIKTFGNDLVVFKANSIGVISGYGMSTWADTKQYVRGVGCAGGHTIKNARIGGSVNKDVLLFLSYDGLYAFDGSQSVTKVSHPIHRKFIATNSADKFNESRFANAVATTSDKYNWYVLSISDGSDTTNDFVLIFDLIHPFETPDGVFSVPCWPCDGVNANAITTRKSSSIDKVYFGGNDGFVYLYSESLFSEDGAAYEGYFQTKIFDMRKNCIVREYNVLGADLGEVDAEFFLAADLEDPGMSASVTMTDDAYLLDATFVLDVSTLSSGSVFVYKKVPVYRWGRFMQLKLSQSVLSEQMDVESIDLVVKDMGLLPYV